MSISPVKRLILETMWMMDKPVRATEIAKEAGLSFPPVMMHILGLTKLGFTETLEKGTYAITEVGKKALGLPEVGKEKAAQILGYMPVERSFHFYADVGKPLNAYAASLGDFCDKILKVDGKVMDDFSQIPRQIILNEARTIEVLRDNQVVDVPVPKDFISKLIRKNTATFISVRIPFVAASFPSSSPARDAGVLAGDRIIGVNDTLHPYFDEFRSALTRHKNQEVRVMLLRGADTLSVPVKVPASGLIGIYPKTPDQFLQFAQRDYSFLAAIPAGFVNTFDGAWPYIRSIRLLFTQEKAFESVGGFISIGNIFPSIWNWEAFWSLTAFLSIMLAILNVLPIPALDGGHVMFLLYEVIFRRKPSDKFMEYAQIVGMILLFGLLIFANANDIIKLFR